MFFLEEPVFRQKQYKKQFIYPAAITRSSRFVIPDVSQVDFVLPSFGFIFGFIKLLWHVGVPFSFLMSGLVIIATQIVIPKISEGVTPIMVKPVVGDVLAASSVNQVLTGSEEFEFSELKRYKEESQVLLVGYPKNFSLTVPKLGIKDFVVETNAVTLKPDSKLGHYKGSCLPGQICKGRSDSFIYGHSALPAFYDPTDPKKVFSKLDDLEPGDKFFVDYNGENLVYRVNFKKVVEPEELDPLNPPNPFSIGKPTMTLMTCTPAGTTKYRLVVSGELL